MRWRVNGLDASSGNAVLLDVEADNAVEAVAHAHDRDIVVSHVVKAGGERVRKALPFLAAVALITLGLATVVLENQRRGAGRALGESEVAAQRMLGELQATRTDLAAAQGRVRFLEGTQSQRAQGSDGEIRELRARAVRAESAKAVLEQTGKEAAARIAELAAGLEETRVALAAAQERWKAERTTLEADLKGARESHRKAADELTAVKGAALKESARAARLEAQVGQLAEQVKAADDHAVELKAKLEDSRLNDGALRHALAIPYDDALAFAALELGKPTVQAGRDAVAVSATQADRANTFLMHTDKDRVFDATLQACLTADAPKEVLAANQALVEKFASSFAPRWKEHSAWLAKSLKQVGPGSGRGENERLVLTTDQYHISLWCNRDGQYSLKVEPAVGE